MAFLPPTPVLEPFRVCSSSPPRVIQTCRSHVSSRQCLFTGQAWVPPLKRIGAIPSCEKKPRSGPIRSIQRRNSVFRCRSKISRSIMGIVVLVKRTHIYLEGRLVRTHVSSLSNTSLRSLRVFFYSVS